MTEERRATEAAIRAAVLAEREACAKACRRIADKWQARAAERGDIGWGLLMSRANGAEDCAAALLEKGSDDD